MNEYLTLTYDILNKTRGSLTASQICDYAIVGGMAQQREFVMKPAALGRMLAQEARLAEGQSVFGTLPGEPATYFLKSISGIWGDIEHQADNLESIAPDLLLQQIRARSPQPLSRIITVHVYDRDPNVIAYVRLRAEHCCELCGNKGFTKTNGRHYLEVHHLVQLSAGGKDIPENAAAVCGDCHRRLHFADNRLELLKQLKAQLKDKFIIVPKSLL